jgi:hypothetical protein
MFPSSSIVGIETCFGTYHNASIVRNNFAIFAARTYLFQGMKRSKGNLRLGALVQILIMFPLCD